MVEVVDVTQLPKKGEHRQRAHCNPLSDAYIRYPLSPDYVDWSVHYPHYFPKGLANPNKDTELHLNTDEDPINYSEKQTSDLNGTTGRSPEILDIGCGFGGLSFALATYYPEKLILGIEIRDKVAQFVGKKILALRSMHQDSGQYRNVSCLRTNSMKFLTNYIRKDSIDKIFICFPDPHFKRSNWPRRIITPQLLSVYAYVLKDAGKIYFVSDVRETFDWMQASAECHPLFSKAMNLDEDYGFKAMQEVTEEGQKAIRLGESIYAAAYICKKGNIAEPRRAPCEFDHSSSSEGFVSVHFIPTISPIAPLRIDASKCEGREPWNEQVIDGKNVSIKLHRFYRATEKWRRASGMKHKIRIPPPPKEAIRIEEKPEEEQTENTDQIAEIEVPKSKAKGKAKGKAKNKAKNKAKTKAKAKAKDRNRNIIEELIEDKLMEDIPQVIPQVMSQDATPDRTKDKNKEGTDEESEEDRASSSSPTSQNSPKSSTDTESPPSAPDAGNEPFGPGRKRQSRGRRARGMSPSPPSRKVNKSSPQKKRRSPGATRSYAPGAPEQCDDADIIDIRNGLMAEERANRSDREDMESDMEMDYYSGGSGEDYSDECDDDEEEYSDEGEDSDGDSEASSDLPLMRNVEDLTTEASNPISFGKDSNRKLVCSNEPRGKIIRWEQKNEGLEG